MQIFIFIICMFCGILSGIVYDVLYVARCFVCGINKADYTPRDKIFLIAADLLYFLVFAAGFIFVSVMFGFSALRFYMLLGCFAGAFVYLKSFHVIVAFCVKKVYNRFTKYKEQHVEKRKKKPHARGGNRKRNTFNNNSRRGGNLSARGYHRRHAPKSANSGGNNAA
ncbi:MAG: spore cortex biosynthesis protein YabQ [Clostridia bacterium]|nr:spore cortex biosynthesis protein YabQ [Clostridia bacterium]